MQQIEFDDEDHTKLLDTVVSGSMASHGFKTLSYAYKQIPEDELNSIMQQYHIESDDFREYIQSRLVYLGTFGLEDSVRDDVDKSIQLIKYGTLLGDHVDRKKGAKNQVNIRMITGDHLDTALHVAL
jgi:magnesium-transporting ATPase (P-type)